jgi:hypothetical protein
VTVTRRRYLSRDAAPSSERVNVSKSALPVCLSRDHDASDRRNRVRYMLLIHHGDEQTRDYEEAWAALSPEEQKAITDDYQAISQAPGVTPGLWLQPPEAATTVRVRDGRTLITDGPFPEIKEALGGYLVFEADDIDAAIELAARIPAARMGGAVEVRPVQEW